MKKQTDKPNVTVNINILSNITLDGKTLIPIIIVILSLTLVLPICDSTACAEIIRLLISMASDC